MQLKSGGKGFFRIFTTGIGGEGNRGYGDLRRAKRAEKRVAVFTRHRNIGDQHGWTP